MYKELWWKTVEGSDISGRGDKVKDMTNRKVYWRQTRGTSIQIKA